MALLEHQYEYLQSVDEETKLTEARWLTEGPTAT